MSKPREFWVDVEGGQCAYGGSCVQETDQDVEHFVKPLNVIDKKSYDKAVEALKVALKIAGTIDHVVSDNGIFEEHEGQAANIASELEDYLSKTLKELGHLDD